MIEVKMEGKTKMKHSTANKERWIFRVWERERERESF